MTTLLFGDKQRLVVYARRADAHDAREFKRAGGDVIVYDIECHDDYSGDMTAYVGATADDVRKVIRGLQDLLGAVGRSE